VRTDGVVLDQPVGQLLVEFVGVLAEVPPCKELLLEGPVKALVGWVVLRCPGSGPEVWQLQVLEVIVEMLMELGPVVRVDVPDVPEQIMHPLEEVPGGRRGVRGVHPGMGNLRVIVRCRYYVSPDALEMKDNRVEMEKKARLGYSGTFGYPFLDLRLYLILAFFLPPLPLVEPIVF